jgi:hypothetical protein
MRENALQRTEALSVAGSQRHLQARPRSGPTPTPPSPATSSRGTAARSVPRRRSSGDLAPKMKGEQPAAEAREANKRGVLGCQSSGTWVGCSSLGFGARQRPIPTPDTPVYETYHPLPGALGTPQRSGFLRGVSSIRGRKVGLSADGRRIGALCVLLRTQ